MITRRVIGEFYGAAHPYITLFNAFAEKHKLVGRALADHICYKCGSDESFEEMQALLASGSGFWLWRHDEIISGRPISYFRLKRPFKTALGNIEYLELCDQKPDGSQVEGYDHIEVYPVGSTYEEMVEEFAASGEDVTEAVRPHHTTHDICIEGGDFLFRCTREPLVDKISRQMK